MLNRVLAGMANHPNIGGVVMIGLGCEQVTLDYLIESHQLVALHGNQSPRSLGPHRLTIQECGGTRRTVEAEFASGRTPANRE